MVAMLAMAMIATLASGSVWMQWRQVEIETAERGRAQGAWLLAGLLDWARLSLAEDARSASSVDHLGEPWAKRLEASRLSTFLGQETPAGDDEPDVSLDGQITDAQSRLNLVALALGSRESIDREQAAWSRLFKSLNLPASDLDVVLKRWPEIVEASGNPQLESSGTSPLLPRRLDQFVWLGMSPRSLEALAPYVTMLPESAPVNLNSALVPVLQAMIPGLDRSTATQLVVRREQRPWRSVQEFELDLGALSQGGPRLMPFDNARLSVKSRYFEVRGTVRIGRSVLQEETLVERNGRKVRILWRRSLPPGHLAPGQARS
jgi:general secretion pathway protein K